MSVKIQNFKYETNFFADISDKNERSLEHVVYLAQKKHNADLRSGTACCKTRAEVRYTNAKPFKQKGSGRARRGTNRTPLRRGGGVIFGPKPRSFSTKLNKKVLSYARKSLLFLFRENTFVISGTDFISKTKDLNNLLKNQFKDVGDIVMVLSSQDDNLWRYSLNLPIHFSFVEELDFSSFLNSKIVVLSENAAKELS